MRAVCLQHVHFEGPGAFATALTDRGVSLEHYLVPKDGLPKDAGDLLMVMGGPMSVNDPDPWIVEETAFIRSALLVGKPVIGACLGSQFMAKALGATVRPGKTLEIGMTTIRLTAQAKEDPVFGTVVMAGMGGVGAELLDDRSLGFPPLNERLATRMLESLRMWPLFTGYRGRKPLAVDALVEVLIRLSYLAADYPEITELDINPLLCTPDDVVALDARVVLDRSLVGVEAEPYAHLALRPYPEGFVTRIVLKDGTAVMLRPIKPEDEPLWLAMLGSCSKETIYSRFRYLFDWSTHEVATRYCYIDYAREIAIVAEIGDGEGRKLIGVGRLIADPGHEEGEYAVLIVDAWQRKELGGILTDYCIEIARRWKLKRVVAQTTSDNRPMIRVFEKRGFAVVTGEDSTVEVSKAL